MENLFIRWVRFPDDPPIRSFWENWILKYPAMKETVDSARELVLAASDWKPEALSNQDINSIWDRIRSSLDMRTDREPKAPSSNPDGSNQVLRQIILIINVLISVVCVAVFVWVAARHWSVGKRLGLSMGSSLAVAVAEVVVYSGYVRKVAEAKRVEKKKPEIKEIVASWVLDKNGEGEGEGAATGKEKDDGVRYRKGKHR